jgi:ribosome biogenesis GTPase A
MESYWDVIKRIIEESDIVLEILDARLIELSRNEDIESLVKESGRPLIYVVNKSDLISDKILKKQLKELPQDSNVVFISAKSPRLTKILLYAIKKTFSEHGKRDKTVLPEDLQFREAKGKIVVGIVGYPNVGKSSVINALAHRQKAKVSKRAGTTHGLQWVTVTNEIKMLDSPGVIPLKKDDEVRYSLIGARNPEKIIDPENVAISIIDLFFKYDKRIFESFYSIEITEKDYDKIIQDVAVKKGYLARGGIPDMNRTCYQIIRDWQQGRLKL